MVFDRGNINMPITACLSYICLRWTKCLRSRVDGPAEAWVSFGSGRTAANSSEVKIDFACRPNGGYKMFVPIFEEEENHVG